MKGRSGAVRAAGLRLTRREFTGACAALATSGLGGWLSACGDDASVAPGRDPGAPGTRPYTGQGSAFSYRGPSPNLLVVVADDLSAHALSLYGGSIVTPNLERLAAEGLRFENCFSSSTCLPSWIQLFTGRYVARASMAVPSDPRNPCRAGPLLDSRELTAPRLLAGAAYRAGVAGKGLAVYSREAPGHPGQLGFDSWCITHQRGRAERSELALDVDGSLVSFLPGREDEELVDYLSRFIQQPSDSPFLAFYTTRLGHKPWLPPRPDGDAVWEPPPAGPEYYAAEIAYLDRQLGRLLDLLESEGLERETLVLFLADNGGPKEVEGAAQVRGHKATLFEGGVRVPLVARWPGEVPAGQVNAEDLVEFTDFLPTFAELAGVALPADRTFDGVSLWPVLKGSGERRKDWVFLNSRLECALRTRRWKLMANGNLFDLATDPGERHPIPPGRSRGEAAAARSRLEAVLRGVIRAMLDEGAEFRTIYA